MDSLIFIFICIFVIMGFTICAISTIKCFQIEKQQKKFEKTAYRKNTFKDIENLPENWNGYGAEPISQNVIDTAKRIYSKMNPKPDGIFPTACDSVQLEWYVDNLCCLEFDISIDSVDIFLKINNFKFSGSCPTDNILFLQKIVEIYFLLIERSIV